MNAVLQLQSNKRLIGKSAAEEAHRLRRLDSELVKYFLNKENINSAEDYARAVYKRDKKVLTAGNRTGLDSIIFYEELYHTRNQISSHYLEGVHELTTWLKGPRDYERLAAIFQ